MSRKSPALSQLQGVLTVLDNRTKRPASEVLSAVGEIVRDVISVLMEPDPMKQRIAFVLLSIQQSTEVRLHMRNGKQITRVHVVEKELYDWAMAEVHKIAGAGR